MNKILTNPHLVKLNEAFSKEGFELRTVGGAVRDLFLNIEPKDIDLATNATPEEMNEVGKKHKISNLMTNADHGTVVFIIDKISYEITTLRIDKETDGRHAIVEFTRSFEEDAKRRDLTFNAMSLDFNGKVYDYFKGREDLAKNIVRFVGNAESRIKEDYLRILRYFRFAARFDSKFDKSTLDILTRADIHQGLKTISKERVWLEMQKLLTYPARTRIIQTMNSLGIYKTIGLTKDPDYDKLKLAKDEISALSCLVDHKDVSSFSSFWKLSNDERSKLRFVSQNHILSKENIEDMLVQGKPLDWVVSWLSLVDTTDYLEMINYAENFDPPSFPIDGYDLLSLGLKTGKELGSTLEFLRKEWFNSRFTLTKEELLKRIKI